MRKIELKETYVRNAELGPPHAKARWNNSRPDELRESKMRRGSGEVSSADLPTCGGVENDDRQKRQVLRVWDPEDLS
jgi:hypothetical protein